MFAINPTYWYLCLAQSKQSDQDFAPSLRKRRNCRRDV